VPPFSAAAHRASHTPPFDKSRPRLAQPQRLQMVSTPDSAQRWQNASRAKAESSRSAASVRVDAWSRVPWIPAASARSPACNAAASVVTRIRSFCARPVGGVFKPLKSRAPASIAFSTSFLDARSAGRSTDPLLAAITVNRRVVQVADTGDFRLCWGLMRHCGWTLA